MLFKICRKIKDMGNNEIIRRLEDVESKVKNIQFSNDVFLDNQEFLQVMNISKRTAQTWRDGKIVAYSQIGCKIYYKVSDIKALLKKNYNKAK